MDAVLDEDATEFHPGYTQYTVDISMQDGTETVILMREIVHNSFSPKGKVHPVLVQLAVRCVKNYIAKIYTQSSY